MQSVYRCQDGQLYHEDCVPQDQGEPDLVPADDVVEGLVCSECGGPLVDEEGELGSEVCEVGGGN
jgi:hypothetical protein